MGLFSYSMLLRVSDMLFEDLRLLEITDAHVNPVILEEAPAESVEAVPEAEVQPEPLTAEIEQSETETEAETVIGGLPPATGTLTNLTGSMNFRFVQESELDSDPVSFENGAEWVEREDVPQAHSEDGPAFVAINGTNSELEPVPVRR